MRRPLGAGMPVRASELAVVGVVMLLVTLGQTTSVFGWAPVRWTEVNALPHVVLLISGPAAGIIGAFAARTCVTALVTMAPGRMWSEIMRRQLLPVLVAAWLGYLLGLVPAIVLAARRATFGTLDVLGLFAGSAGIVLCCGIGYAIGSKLRFARAGAVALAACLVVTVGLMALSDALTSLGMPTSLVAVIPFWAFDISRGWTEVPTVNLFRGLTLVAFACLTLTLVAVGRDRSWSARRERWSQVVVSASAPILMVGVALVVQPDVVRAARPVPIRCAPLSSGSLCMYAEEAAVLPEAAQVIEDVERRFGLGASTGDAWSLRPEDVANGVTVGDVLISPQYGGTRANFSASLQGDVAASISGVRACETQLYERYGANYFDAAPASALESAVVQEMLANSLVVRLGGARDEGLVLPGDETTPGWPRSTELLRRIDAMTDGEISQWMLDHAAALRSCEARPSDLGTA